jgi:outer membrane protein assembly factor BamB
MAGARITSKPMPSADACFFACEDESVSAVDLMSGQRIWTKNVPGSGAALGLGNRFGSAGTLGRGAVSDGVLYLAGARELVAIEATTGEILWTTDGLVASGTAPLTVALAENEIVVTYRDQIMVIRRSTGTRLWNVTVDENVTGPAAVAGGLVVVNCRTKCSAWHLHDGTPAWSTPLNNYFHGGAPAIIRAGVAYVGDADGSLHALDVDTGERRWSTGSQNGGWLDEVGGRHLKSAGILMPPVATDSRVVVGLINCKVQCVDLRGKWRWSHLTMLSALMNPREASDLPDPVVAGDLVIEGGMKRIMQAWNLQTGAEVWKVRRRRGPTTSLAYASGMLLYGAGRTLFAHDAHTGKGPWTLWGP